MERMAMQKQSGYERVKPREVNDQWNCSNMLRDIIQGVMEEKRWGLNECARQLNESKATLHRFLNGEQTAGGWVWPEGKIGLITSLCRCLNVSPGELFSMHPHGRVREGNAQHLAAITVGPVPVLEILRDALDRGRLEESFRTVYALAVGEPASSVPVDTKAPPARD